MAWLWVAALAVPVVVTAGVLGHLDRAVALLVRTWRRIRPERPQSHTVSVEQLVSDLRRLADALEQAYATEQPSKMERVTAAALAYDWVLLSACRTLEVPAPGFPPWRAMERLETEVALAREGLQW
jgi:hypothetical protein